MTVLYTSALQMQGIFRVNIDETVQVYNTML